MMVGELFKMRAGIDIVTVPYRGAANVMIDMLGGQIDMAFEPTSVTIGHVREGNVRPLAVTGTTRSPAGRRRRLLQSRNTRLGHHLILTAAAAAYSDRADELAVGDQRQPAGGRA